MIAQRLPMANAPAAVGRGMDFEAFFSANVDRARRLAWRLLDGDAAAADDVVQDAFVKAYRSLASFRTQARIETWFYRILVNEAKNHRRWRQVRRLFGIRSQRDAEPRHAVQCEPDLRRRISQALGHLSAPQRDACILVYLEGFTVKEAARILDKAEGTVKTHLHRAVRSLRAELADYQEPSS
ncbi:MAG: RNA polymerase sigma factor [Proteobacteria bacterium]|nr:RNA polymerase sigma factor [Pseudomonadota bacterium]